MSCLFAHDDGAYVLGALSPAERQDFERHLSGCADCTRAVRELAGLPGLLARADASHLEQPDADDAAPETLLPALAREAGRARRRRTWTVVAALAAAAVVALVVVRQTADHEPVGPPAAAMAAVGDAPVSATLSLEQVAWGTRLGLVCTYEAEWGAAALPAGADYTLLVRTRDGRVEEVGSWQPVEGVPMRISAGTAADLDELASVEVQAADGRVVLRLAT